MAVNRDEKPSATIGRFQQNYSDIVVLRMSIQAIPWIGGPLDTLLAGRATQIQLERVDKFAKELAQRMATVESSAVNLNDEAFADLMFTTFERAARTRSEEKRSRFAEIIANQVAKPAQWEEPENAVRLLADLEDIHIEIIETALKAPVADGPFSGLRVISLKAGPNNNEQEMDPVSLFVYFPQYEAAALRMACAELVAKGLLHDEGIGRVGLGAMQYFVPTDLAEWFSAWISRARRE